MLRCLQIGTWAWAVLLAGCQVYEPTLLDERGEFAATRADGGSGRAAPPATDGCTDAIELCNTEDDDCDGHVDEGAGAACRLRNALSACGSDGTCVIADCEQDYLDCNGRSSDGCEQATSALQCGVCGTRCLDDGGLVLPDSSVQVGATDAAVEPVDPAPNTPANDGAVATNTPPEQKPECVRGTETCNQKDDDCDDKVDEAPANCALDACIASTPSYRGARCDRCACERCGPLVAQCQNHMDARWAMLCRDVTECYVISSRAGDCGSNGDCYGSGNGPCAGEINLAAGGTSATDNSRTASGCTTTSPPTTACGAVSIYRNQCTRDRCAAECAE